MVTLILFFFTPFLIFYTDNFSIDSIYNTLKDEMFYKNLVDYFIPLNYELLKRYIANEYINLSTKIFGSIVYILGKIFTAYGVFEVVQAFRKFNTKGN